MKRVNKILLFLFLVALIIRITFLYSFLVKIWDETVYVNLGYDLSKNPFDYSFDRLWSDYVPIDWPKAGFRPPLLPYTLSVLFYLNLDSLIDLLLPIIGASSVILVFLLAREMLNEKNAIYSAIFLTVLPVHAYFSGRILTDVFSTFFIILTALFFWKGFEKGEIKYKILFGFSLALCILSRYTSIVMIPIFIFYLIIKNKNLLFLKDKFLWLSVGLFFLTLSPWFFYGINTYNNPLGPFIHSIRLASYLGGMEPWYFSFLYLFFGASVISIIFIISLIFIILNKKIRNLPAVLFLIIWFSINFIFILITPHKETRYILPIVAPLVIISSLFLNTLKKYRKQFLNLTILLLIISVLISLTYTYQINFNDQKNYCFLKANEFLKNLPNNSLVITDESTTVYYYSKKATHFYPYPFSLDNLRNLINTYYINKSVYILSIDTSYTSRILDNNFDIIYRCPEYGNISFIYKYR